MSRIIGIDLGTTNSVVAIIEDGDPTVVPNEEGSRTTPSVVAITPDGDRLVGQFARRQAVTNPDRTFFAVKRIIGRRFDDPAVARFAERAPFKVKASDRGDAWLDAGTSSPMSPPQISAMVLEKMRATAETYLGESVDKAIVTVPAYFDDSQRQATKDAGKLAGLEVLRIINEPTAAALAYGLGKTEQERIAVFDLGGGTFDVSILVLDDGVFEVRATNGDTFLGGEDFDNRIVDRLLEHFREETGEDLAEQPVPLQRLKEASEKAKRELSTVDSTDINLPFITSIDSGPVHLRYTLTRDELESLTADLVDRLEGPCSQALKDAGLRPGELSSVLLVGGMTRMPKVREKVRTIFNLEPRTDINPDEVVALGAAVQGAVLSGDIKAVLLLDVTPLTLGIEIAGGLVEPIIPRNTTIPCKKGKVFTTALDNQDMVRVHVVQGERPLADENKSLGRLEMHGLPPAPRGLPEIQVNFELDANGIMHVEAKDLGTGKAQSMRIVSHSGLSDGEIEVMLREAESFRDEDERRRELGETRNALEGLVYTTRRSVDELGQLLDSADETFIREAILVSEEALESNDLDMVLDARDQLAVAAERLAESIYSGASATLDEDYEDEVVDDWDEEGALAD